MPAMAKYSCGVLAAIILINYATLITACAQPSGSIYDALRQDCNSAHQSLSGHVTNSACNTQQYQHLGIEVAYNIITDQKVRRRGDTLATDEAFQLMNSSIQVAALEPNYIVLHVQTDVVSALKSDDPTFLLSSMNTQVTTQQHIDNVIPAPVSPTAPRNASVKSGAGRTGRSEVRIGLIVALVIAMVLIPCLMFNFWLFSVYF